MSKKFRELTSLPFKNGEFRLCLDEINDEKGQYAFVWRGTSKSKDGFIPRPAQFDWESLGKLIKLAFEENRIREEDKNDFFKQLRI